MTAYQNELVIDFGEVGFRNSKHSFRVRLDSRPLTQLIEAGDLDAVLREASGRAKSMRPRLL